MVGRWLVPALDAWDIVYTFWCLIGVLPLLPVIIPSLLFNIFAGTPVPLTPVLCRPEEPRKVRDWNMIFGVDVITVLCCNVFGATPPKYCSWCNWCGAVFIPFPLLPITAALWWSSCWPPFPAVCIGESKRPPLVGGHKLLLVVVVPPLVMMW